MEFAVGDRTVGIACVVACVGAQAKNAVAAAAASVLAWRSCIYKH